MDDTRSGISETMHVDVGYKNESSAEINQIEAITKERIHWRSGGQSGYSKNVLVRQNFTLDASMAEGASNRGTDDSLLREIQRAIRDGTNRVPLTIPSKTLPTYNGTLMGVNHI